MIKILFIHHGSGIGGAPISLLNLVKALNPRNYKIKVALLKGGVVEDLFKERGFETEVINDHNLLFAHNETDKIHWRYFYRYIKMYFHWRRTANEEAPRYLSKQSADIVHVNSHVLTSWAYAAKKSGKFVVMHNREAVAHGYFGIRYRILRKLIERSCDHIINISEDNSARLGIAKRSSVVYNFVEIPSSFRKCMAPQDRLRKVLFLGGMSKIKGYGVVVECLKYLDSNITVQFAGSFGKLEEDRSIKGKLMDWIKLNFFAGTYRGLRTILRSTNGQILGLLKDSTDAIDGCDILITPFRNPHFSRPAIEALAYGKPVIGSDVIGMDEIVDHGINGLLVQKDNPKALADAINYLCANPLIAQEMGRNGREKAVRMFSPQANIGKIEAVYERLMAGN